MPRACRIRDVLSATAALPLGSRAAAGGIALTSPRASSRPPGTPHAQRERERETSERASTRVSTRRAFGPLPRSRPVLRGKRHATILGAARGHGGPDLCRCVRVWRARGAGASPAHAGDKVPDEAASCGSVRIGPGPRAQPQVGGWTEKRGGASIPAAAVAWRGVALSAYPTGYHTMPCIPGVARVHDGWEWLSYSRTRRADGGTRTAARCTPRCGRLVFVFFPTPPSPRRACRRRPCVPPLPFLF